MADSGISAEERRLRRRLLDIVILTLLASAAVGCLTAWAIDYRDTARALALATPVFPLAYWLARRRLVEAAGVIIVAVMLAVVTYISYVGFGINDSSMVLHALAILVASLLLKRTPYVLFVLVAVVNVMWLIFGEMTGRLTFAEPRINAGMLLIVPVMLVACALIARVMTENLRHGLVRARVRADSLRRAEAEQRRLVAEKGRLVAELEAKNAQLEHFAYAVSHDLKSPLLTIRGHLGYLEKDALAGRMERVRSSIERVNGAAAKMEELLAELRELSRVGRVANPRETVPFTELVRDARELVAGRLAERRVDVDVAPDLPSVEVDRARLVSVLQNLIDNAVKFMGDQAEPRISIGADPRGSETVFFVRDNGVGLEAGQERKIFGLFERLDPAVEGSGMGLALVEKIVEVHGGRIWAESDGPGAGTTFRFTLEARDPVDLRSRA